MGNDYDTMRLQAAHPPLEGSVPPPTSAKTALTDHLRDQKLFDNASGETLNDDSDPAGRFKRHGRVRGHVYEV